MKIMSLFVVLAFVGCSDSGNVKTEKTKEDPNLPPINVSLPSPPPASAFVIQEKNPDGTFRIEGMIHNQTKHLDKVVTLSGTIARISKACDPKKAKKKGKTCNQPSMYIKDGEGAKKFLKVVGYTDDFIKRSKVEVGKAYTFKGTYKKMAQGFVVTEDGLLLLDFVNEIPVLLQK